MELSALEEDVCLVSIMKHIPNVLTSLGLKFDTLKAIQIIFWLSFNKEYLPVERFKLYKVNQKTVWAFKRKFQ